MKEVNLGSIRATKHKGVALVDDEDFEKVSSLKWFLDKGYAVTRKQGSRKKLYLHHFVLENQGEIDHRNLDPLDNRRVNLRPCSHAENEWNKRKISTNTSGYRGVCFEQRQRKWSARICRNGKSKRLGLYFNPKEAAKAYDAYCILHDGEFARPNFDTKATSRLPYH